MRIWLYLLLAIVALAAAVLSFSALMDLAIICGFSPWLAWLLPITVDAGAGAASIVWLARWVDDGARSYGRVLALVLLASSVAGNAVDHYLRAYGIAPKWWVVVIVSAVAPAVLAALVHLVMLVARSAPAEDPGPGGRPAGKDGVERAEAGSGADLSDSPPSPPATPVSLVKATSPPPQTLEQELEQLVARGWGRGRVLDELQPRYPELTEDRAKALIRDAKASLNGAVR